MNKRKESNGPPGAVPKRKSSLGLRSWITGAGGGDDKHNEIASSSRPRTMQRSNSGLNLKSIDFSTGLRIPRASSRDSHSRRSSSHEPSARRQLEPSPDFQHMQNVGLLLTPVRPTPSRSPSSFSMASSCRGSSVRRPGSIHRTGPPPKMKDERPISDKMFQANAISKIQNFMRNNGTQPMKLKPMSNNALITTFNSIIETVDSSLTVPANNYVEALPNILRHLQYPTVLPKSTFIAVGSGHATQQLIAMLLYVLESCEALQGVDIGHHLFLKAAVSEEERVLKSTIMVLFKSFECFIAQQTPCTEEDYIDMLFEELGESRDEEHNLQDDIIDLQAKLEECFSHPERTEKEEKVRLLDQMEALVRENEEEDRILSEALTIRKSTISKNRETISQFDVDLNRIDDHAAEIQDQVARQTMKAAERDEIRRQCEIARQEGTIKSSYLDKLQNVISKIDVNLATTRKKIGDVTQDINCSILEVSLDESLKWTHNPNFKNLELTYPDNMIKSWSAYQEQLVRETKDLQVNITTDIKDREKLQEVLKKSQNEVKAKNEEVCRLDSETIGIQLHYTELDEKLKEETELEVVSCLKYQAMLNALPKLADVEAQIKCVLDEKETVKMKREAYKNYLETKLFRDIENLQKKHMEEYVKPEIAKIRKQERENVNTE